MFIGSGSEGSFLQLYTTKSMRLGVANPPWENDSSSSQWHIVMLLRNKRLCDASSAMSIDFKFLQASMDTLLRTGRDPKVKDVIESQLSDIDKSSSDV